MNAQEKAHYLANRHPDKVIVKFDCGHAGKKHKHHPDYSLPLEVELLCTKCHGERRRGSTNKKEYMIMGPFKGPIPIKQLIGLSRRKLLGAGFKQSTLTMYANGQRVPAFEIAAKIAAICGVSITDIPYRREEINRP